MSKAHLTAIGRKKPSLPMQWLHSEGKFKGTMLDYGCGKGLDADTYGMDKFDPHFTEGLVEVAYTNEAIPMFVIGQVYDVITCNYVLNVIESETERAAVLETIRDKLAKGGVAYITVRRDSHIQEGFTSKGTYQATIELDLPVEREVKGKYIMYRLEK